MAAFTAAPFAPRSADGIHFASSSTITARCGLAAVLSTRPLLPDSGSADGVQSVSVVSEEAISNCEDGCIPRHCHYCWRRSLLQSLRLTAGVIKASARARALRMVATLTTSYALSVPNLPWKRSVRPKRAAVRKAWPSVSSAACSVPAAYTPSIIMEVVYVG